MILEFLLVLLSIFFIVLIGLFLIVSNNLLPKIAFVKILPYCFGLGVGVIGIQMYAYSRIGIPWNNVFILLPHFVYFLYSFKNVKRILRKKKPIFYLSKIEIFLLFTLLFLISYVGIEVLLRPLLAWDGWASWLLKAKVFYLDGRINPSIFSYLESEYPLLISLVSSFLYVVLGSVNDKLILLLFYFFYLFLGFSFLTSIKELGLKKALLYTFIFLATQNLIRHGGRFEAGQADLALSYYFFCSFSLLLLYIQSKNSRFLVLLQIFLGITTLIKNEGITYTFFLEIITIYYCIKNKHFSSLFLLCVWLLPILDWQFYKKVHHLEPVPPYLTKMVHIERLPMVVGSISKEFINIKNWNLLWIIFWFSTIFYVLSKKITVSTILLIIILFQLFCYIIVFLTTAIDPLSHIQNVIDRLLLHLAPLAMLFSVVIIEKFFLKKINSR